MEHDHRRGRVHELPVVRAVGHGRIRRQRMAGRRRADAAARPSVDRHQAEGAGPGADDRHRLCPHHVQPLRQRAVPRQGRRRGEEARRRHRHHRSGQGQGPQGPGRKLPLRPHLVERGIAASADLAVRRASARPGLAADPRPAGLPDRRDARDQGRGRRDGAHGARRKPRGDEARGRHQAARLLPQPLALQQKLHRRQRGDRSERRGRLRRGRDRAPDQGRPDGRARHHRQLRRLQVRQARRELRPLHHRGHRVSAAPRCSTPVSAPAFSSARSGCSGSGIRRDVRSARSGAEKRRAARRHHDGHAGVQHEGRVRAVFTASTWMRSRRSPARSASRSNTSR